MLTDPGPIVRPTPVHELERLRCACKMGLLRRRDPLSVRTNVKWHYGSARRDTTALRYSTAVCLTPQA